MAVLDILHFPDQRLRIKAKPVETVNSSIQQFVDNMFETMYAAPGVGLAATQVNVHKQILVIDISEKQNQPLCFINAKIIESKGEETLTEGCLSVPGVFEDITRHKWIKVQALNQQGERFELETEGLLAQCIQHEMDHLQGKLFVDYLSNLKRQRIRKKLEKQQKYRA